MCKTCEFWQLEIHQQRFMHEPITNRNVNRETMRKYLSKELGRELAIDEVNQLLLMAEMKKKLELAKAVVEAARDYLEDDSLTPSQLYGTIHNYDQHKSESISTEEK